MEPELRQRTLDLIDRGVNALDDGNNARAIELFARANANYGRISAGWNNLAIALQRAQRYDDADAAYARAAELDPTDYRPVFNRGLLHFERGFLREAGTFFERAADIDDAQLGPLVYAIRVDQRLGRQDENTLELIERAMMLETNPVYLTTLRSDRIRLMTDLERRSTTATSNIVPNSDIERVAPDLDEEQRRRLLDPVPSETLNPPADQPDDGR